MMLYGLAADLHERLFPKTIERLLCIAVSHGSRHGTPVRFRPPSEVAKRLVGLRSDRQLRDAMLRWPVKDLLSLHWICLQFLLQLAKLPVESLRYQEARRLMGRRPTPLKYARAAIAWWRAVE